MENLQEKEDLLEKLGLLNKDSSPETQKEEFFEILKISPYMINLQDSKLV
jgi:hypothetical protein